MNKIKIKFIGERKKGDISASFLITVILAVLAFVIILLVFSQFGWNERTDKDICHESVIFRATLPSFANSKEFVPLKCSTQKICFTSGIIGGNCKEFENLKGVTKVRVSTKDQIEQAIAREIVDCWEMMGEAKLSLFSNWFAETYGFSDVASSCVVCSRIGFDKVNLAKNGINADEINVLDYMMKHYIPDKNMTYYDYLGGSNGKIKIKDDSVSVENLIKELSKTSSLENIKIPANANNQANSNPDLNANNQANANSNANQDELSIVFMQIYAPGWKDVAKNTFYSLLGIGIGSFISAPGATSKLSWSLGKAAFTNPYVGAAAAILGIGVGGYQLYSVFNNNAIAAGKCGDVVVGDKAEKGCSVVRTMNYNSQDLSRYCSTIESIP